MVYNKARQKIRRVVLTVSLSFMAGTLWLFVYLLTQPVSAQAGSVSRNWLGSLHRPAGFARYLIIPDVAKALEQAQLNTTLKKLTQSIAGRNLLASPPPTALQELFRWLEVLPDTIKPTLLAALFPGGIGYVSSEKGSILVAPVSAAGQALLQKKRPRFSAFQGGDFIYASHETLLRAQLSHRATQTTAELMPAAGEIGVVFAPEENPTKEETSILWGAYRAFFPPDMVGPQSIVLSFDKNGIWLRSKALYRKGQVEINKSISKLQPLKYLPRSFHYDGLFLELAADSVAIGSFMQSRPRERQYQPVALYLHRFAADLGRILPEVALIADSRDFLLTEFFSQAFRKGYYTEQIQQGTVRLIYGAHEYQEPQHVFFSPHYRVEKGTFLWAAGSEAFEALSVIHNSPTNKVTGDYANALQLHSFKPPERVLVGVSGNVKNLLQSLATALSYSEAFYAKSSYGDFRDSLKYLLKEINRGVVTGFVLVHPDYVRGSFMLQW